METVVIPGVGLPASRIGLGTWAIGGWMWGGTDDAEAVQTVEAALQQGINLVDTAPVYGFGHSERLVGRALQQHGGREHVIVATKAGLEWDDAGNVRRNARPERIRHEVEASLRRLQTDWIDIYQVHWPDPETPLAATAEILARLRDEGRIRAIGVSNFSPEQMDAFRQVAPLHVCQPPYNLFERGVELDVLPYCAKHGIATLTYGALCRGLLSGRMHPGRRFEGDDLRKVDPKFHGDRFVQYLEAVAHLDHLAREHFDRRVIHVALRWLLDQPGVGVALWGARRAQQLEPLAAVDGWHLDAATQDAIDEILDTCITDAVGPEFMAPP